MNDKNQREKIIAEIRFKATLFYSIAISLPWYLWVLLSPNPPLRGHYYFLIAVAYTLYFFIPAILLGYNFLYSKKILTSYFYGQLNNAKIFSFEIILSIILNSFIWGCIFMQAHFYGASLLFLGIIIGAVIGFISAILLNAILSFYRRNYSK